MSISGEVDENQITNAVDITEIRDFLEREGDRSEMSVTWYTVSVVNGRSEAVEGKPPLDDAILVRSSLIDPSHAWLDFVTDDGSGEVVMTGLFGPGRRLWGDVCGWGKVEF